MKAHDLIGQRFGRLLVLSRVANRRRPKWLCQCDCGNSKVILSGGLRNGTRSCGCLQREMSAIRIGNRKRTHGMSSSAIYTVWEGMIQRCQNPRRSRWECYGGRGISVCAEWKTSAKAFMDWALANGYQRGLQIDRINNDGNYEPANCRFVTSSVNNRNRIRFAEDEPSSA